MEGVIGAGVGDIAVLVLSLVLGVFEFVLYVPLGVLHTPV